MAIIEGPYKIKGTLGNSYFREVDGQTIASSLPSRSDDVTEKAKANHKRFSFVQELYHVICYDEAIHKHWRAHQPNTRGVNTFFGQINGKTVRTPADIDKVKVSPAPNFILEPECELFMDETFLNLRIPVLNPSGVLNSDIENYFKAFGFYYMYNPKKEETQPYFLHAIKKPLTKIQNGSDYNFRLDQLSRNQQPYVHMKDYSNVDVCIALITFTEENSSVRTSQMMRLPVTYLNG